MPAFVSTLCICIVFVPMFFLTGVARYLFVPLAEAVVFAMLASYFLSRTLVPTMAKYLLKAHAQPHGARRPRAQPVRARCSARFDRGFERMRDGYRGAARAAASAAGGLFARVFLARLRRRRCCSSVARRGLLPGVDGGQFKLHLRAPTGTRIEETARALRSRRSGDPRDDPGERARQHHRQHRPALQRHQPVLQQLGADRPADADILVSLDDGPPPDRATTSTICGWRCRRSFPASRSPSCRPTSSARS